MFTICENIQTRFVQFADQKETVKLRVETDPS